MCRPSCWPKTQEHSSLYWKALPLRPGRYRFDVVVKDVNGDRVGTWTHGVVVPEYTEDKLASSSLILADHLEKVPAKSVGAGNFVIGQTKLAYPHIEPANGQPASFRRDEAMNLWMQVYNLQSDEKTKKPSAKFEYEIVNLADNKAGIAHQRVHRHHGQRRGAGDAGKEAGAERSPARPIPLDGESGR